MRNRINKQNSLSPKFLICALLGILLFSFDLVYGQGYRMPPKAIADIVDAKPTPGVSVGPNGEWLLLMERANLPSIAELAQPELRIAGLRINPRNNGPSRGRSITKLIFKNIKTQNEKEVTGLPDDVRMSSIRWSPDGNHIAFLLSKDRTMDC